MSRMRWPGATLGFLVAVSGLLSSSCGDSDVESEARDASSDAPDGSAYTGPCMISAASYDQSCNVDTECTAVTSTNYCSGSCLCGGSAINVAALPKFNEDIAQTPLVKAGGGGCPCVGRPGPCCRNATCTMDCNSPADTLPPCTAANGTCVLSAFSACKNQGPADGCAFSDEVCCVN